MKNFALLLSALTIVGAGCALQKTNPPEAPTPEPVACTMDAKICPDGTGVGRVGPNCEFAPCPSETLCEGGPCPTEPTEPSTMYKPQTINDLTIQPLEVISDSRCPETVQCIWAGTVTLKATLARYLLTDTVTLTLGEPQEFNGQLVTLTEVTPAKLSEASIPPADYQFTFAVVSK